MSHDPNPTGNQMRDAEDRDTYLAELGRDAYEAEIQRRWREVEHSIVAHNDTLQAEANERWAKVQP